MCNNISLYVQECVEEAVAEARIKAIEEGRAEGRAKEREEMLKKLTALGFDISLLSDNPSDEKTNTFD